MAISRVKVWISGEVLTAGDLNGELNNVLNNALSLISPLTGNLNFNNTQAQNFRFEVQTATQSAAQSGRAYWQSSEGTVHVDTGTLIGRVPALVGIQQGELVGILNPTGVSGATTYSRLQVGGGLAITGTQLVTTAAAVSGSASILQVQVFS